MDAPNGDVAIFFIWTPAILCLFGMGTPQNGGCFPVGVLGKPHTRMGMMS